MKRCPYQGKRKFHTKADAELWQQFRPSWAKYRTYECSHCGMWHLTSQKAPRSRRRDAA